MIRGAVAWISEHSMLAQKTRLGKLDQMQVTEWKTSQSINSKKTFLNEEALTRFKSQEADSSEINQCFKRSQIKWQLRWQKPVKVAIILKHQSLSSHASRMSAPRAVAVPVYRASSPTSARALVKLCRKC